MTMAESMIFYRSYMDALEEIEDPAVFREVVQALFYYACDGTEPKPGQLGTSEARIIWKLVKPLIDANATRRENGRLGGRPRKMPKPSEESEEPFAVEEKTIGFDLKKPLVSKSENPTYADEKPNKDINGDKDININIKGDIKGECEGEKPTAPPSPRGPHKRVLLTDEEMQDLDARYGSSTVTEYIRRLDTHLSTGGHKTNHALVIEDWIQKDRMQSRQQDRQKGWHNFREREYDYDLIAEKLRSY